MSSSDVAWCPHMGLKAYFAIASKDGLMLNRVKRADFPKTTRCSRSYRNVAVCTKVEHVKKIDWCRDRRQGDGLVIAAGSRSGRVSLVSFPNMKQAVDDEEDEDDEDDEDPDDEDEDPADEVENEASGRVRGNQLGNAPKLTESPTPYLGNITKVFLPKHSRACVSLRWNPIKIYQVASGHEKTRKNDGCLIWDIRQKNAKTIRGSYYGSAAQQVIAQPITSVGHGDTAMSLAWQPRKSAILAMVRSNCHTSLPQTATLPCLELPHFPAISSHALDD